MVLFLNIHTHHVENRSGILNILSLSVGQDDLAPVYNHQSVAVGIHPWFVNNDTIDKDLNRVRELAFLPQVKMIGECGLDKLKGGPFEQQLAVFEAQMEIAKACKKPLILHCVKAYDELLAMAKKINPQVSMVVHGFNKSEKLGKQLMGHGFLLSFGKVLFNENSGAATIVREIDNFLLETDDSEQPIEEIYEAAAKLKNMTLDDMKALIFANWKRLNLI